MPKQKEKGGIRGQREYFSETLYEILCQEIGFIPDEKNLQIFDTFTYTSCYDMGMTKDVQMYDS